MPSTSQHQASMAKDMPSRSTRIVDASVINIYLVASVSPICLRLNFTHMSLTISRYTHTILGHNWRLVA
jgi:hypothetical protein